MKSSIKKLNHGARAKSIPTWPVLPALFALVGCANIGGFESITGVVRDDENGPANEPPFAVWMRSYSATETTPTSIGIDGDKLWVSGTYQGVLDFGDGELESSTSNFTHVFVARFDSNGTHLQSMGSNPTSSYQTATSMALTTGGVLVGGLAEDGIRIGGCVVSSVAGEAIHSFLAPIDETLTCHDDAQKQHLDTTKTVMSGTRVAAEGTAMFAAIVGQGNTALQVTRSFAEAPMSWFVDFVAPAGGMPPRIVASTMTARSGTIVTGGDFVGKIQIPNGSVLDSPDTADMFIMGQRGSTGEVLWAKTFGGPGEQKVHAATQPYVNNTNELYVTGSFDGEMTMDTNTLSSAGGKDAFIARLDPATGNVRKVIRFGDGSDQRGLAIAFDSATQRVIVAGEFRGTINVGDRVVKNTAIEERIFLMVLSANLDIERLKAYGSGGKQSVSSMDAADGNVYLTGTFTGELDFGDPEWKLANTTTTPAMFVARLKL